MRIIELPIDRRMRDGREDALRRSLEASVMRAAIRA
jgi:hypothetical protein